MKTVEVFYLPTCPYCAKAKKAVEELKSEDEAYGRVPVKWIDESEEVDYANEHNYYHVPTVYYGRHKVFEAHPGDTYEKIREGIRDAFDRSVFEGPAEVPVPPPGSHD